MTSQDVIPSSEMQIDPLRIDIDLARSTSHGSRIFFGRSRTSGRWRNCFVGREFFYRSRIFLLVENFFLAVENFFTAREFFLAVENFLPVEQFLLDRRFFSCRVFVGSGLFRAITYHVV